MTAITSSFSFVEQEKKFIAQTIAQFVNGTANRDVYNMNYILHEDFQAVIFVDETFVVSKSDYMKMLAGKKLGGMAREVEILSLEVLDCTAAVKIRIISNGEVQVMFCHLYMESNGSWQMLHMLLHRVKNA